MKQKKVVWLALLASVSLVAVSCGKTPSSSAASSSAAPLASSSAATSLTSSSVEEKVAVTYAKGEGYTLSGPTSLVKGQDLTFTLTYGEGYEGAVVTSSAGSVVDNKDGSYTIAKVMGDVSISVSGVKKKTFSVSAPTGEHFTFTGETSVEYGASYSYSVVFEKGYMGNVKVNGVDAELDSEGKGLVAVVKANLLITVEGVDVLSYVVTLPTGEGYTLSADKEKVLFGGDVTLTFTLLEGYVGGVVKVNGTAVTFDATGKYTISNVISPLTITVEGIIKTITLDYQAGTGYHFSGPATANLGDPVTFSVIYDSGYRGGTVKAGDSVLTANSDGTYTIPSIGDGTATVSLINVVQTIADAACDFGGTADDMTVTDETSIINTASGYLKSTKIVTPSTAGISAFAAPRVLPNVVLGRYQELRFSIRANGNNAWWELMDSSGSDYGANAEAKWCEIKLVYESEASLYRLYVLDGNTSNPTGWTKYTFDATTNLMDFRIKLGVSNSFYVSELLGVVSAEPTPIPYLTSLASPLTLAGTESTSVLPPVPFATKSTHIEVGWSANSFQSLDLTAFKEVLFYVRSSSANCYTGIKDSSGVIIGSEDQFFAGSWRCVRLLRKSENSFNLYFNNYQSFNTDSSGKQTVNLLALSNLNELKLQLNGAYDLSEVFTIAK